MTKRPRTAEKTRKGKASQGVDDSKARLQYPRTTLSIRAGEATR